MTSRGERGRSPAMRVALWSARLAALPFLLAGIVAWGAVVGACSLARAAGIGRRAPAEGVAEAGVGRELGRITP